MVSKNISFKNQNKKYFTHNSSSRKNLRKYLVKQNLKIYSTSVGIEIL